MSLPQRWRKQWKFILDKLLIRKCFLWRPFLFLKPQNKERKSPIFFRLEHVPSVPSGSIVPVITQPWYSADLIYIQFNISSVVAFQRWWVLKNKLFAQELTCSKEILILATLNHLWLSVVGVLKVDYLDFPCEKFEILRELPASFRFFEFFCFFLIFSAQTRLFLNQK